MKTTFLAALLSLVLMNALAQIPESDEATYEAYLSNLAVNKETWKKAVALRQGEFDRNPNDKNLRFRLALAQYGLLAATMREKDEELFNQYSDKLEEHLDALIEEDESWGDPKALLSGLYGFKIAYSPVKGMYYGPRSSTLIEQALKNSRKSPLVWKLYANSKLFTPEMWGGDINEAIKAYNKSIELYTADKSRATHNWFYIDAFAFLGQAYTKNNQKSEAIEAYEKALTIEPGYTWVKQQLLPEARR